MDCLKMKKIFFLTVSAVFIPMILLSNSAMAVTPQCRAEIIKAANQHPDIGFKLAFLDREPILNFIGKKTETTVSGGQMAMQCMASCTDGFMAWFPAGAKGLILCETARLAYWF
jgi:hypothetical protein